MPVIHLSSVKAVLKDLQREGDLPLFSYEQRLIFSVCFTFPEIFFFLVVSFGKDAEKNERFICH